ncbi:methylated-DNA--[protein]-cysteine S-methyltransferase [Undibacterium jejuense]|uniref:Methylated-DNA--protein-cysteine methyltransferase n=1 Tax=Undibacterium jejuense TaxID=1344949 RepID=A0A923HJL1_9BURK|nr:methylated-DNA--[protein]-cysteine S-methyltransferase [Undibacterium jejuense]MBC3862009.1 methylated-DNA--[protein]-cysteine S-methyltransferase [Undibacterium jejuense]
MKFTEFDSPLGRLTLAASELGLAGVYFEDHRHFKGMDGWQRTDDVDTLNLATQQLGEFFAGTREQFDLPLDFSAGTPFQQQVWRALQAIPFGATLSYGDLARQIENPQAVRAVGAANGRNPISIIVPCHRVIASSGALTGYAGGLKNKQSLLKFEAEKHQSLSLRLT